MTAYPQVAVDAMTLALARRTVGKTKREREQKVRNAREAPTIAAFTKLVKQYTHDKERCGMSVKVNVADASSEEKMRTYAAKDYGEPHAAHGSYVCCTFHPTPTCEANPNTSA